VITIQFPDGGIATFSDAITLGRLRGLLANRYTLTYRGGSLYFAQPVARPAEVYDFGAARAALPALVQEQAS
jgi:hypothetical protein